MVNISVTYQGWGGGGYSDIGPFFWFKILKFNIFKGFQLNEYFLGPGYELGPSINRLVTDQCKVMLSRLYFSAISKYYSQ